MRRLLMKFLSGEGGFLISAELVLICTLLVLGCIAGMAALSEAINTELNEIAKACYNSFQADPAMTTYQTNPPLDLVGTGDSMP
jgi:hypothetical protein